MVPTGSGCNDSEIAGAWEDDYGALWEASLGFPIQVEGMVEENANHHLEVVRAEFGVGSSPGQVDLVRSRLGRDVVACPLPCEILQAHQNLELCSDRIVLRGEKRRRTDAYWHRILVRL
jgi:hypothetical protein